MHSVASTGEVAASGTDEPAPGATAFSASAYGFAGGHRARLSRARYGRTGFVVDMVQRELPASLLDIGCGEGWLIGDSLMEVPRRAGVDTDGAIVERARARYPDCDYRILDAGRLPFDDGEFDCVVLSDVIEHVGDQNKQQVTDEALRVLRPGGRLIVTAPHRGVWAPLDPLDFKRRFPRLYRLTGRRPLTPAEIGHKHVTLNEIERLIAGRAGLEVVEYSGWCAPLGDFPLMLAQFLRSRDRIATEALWRAGRWQTLEASLPAPRFVAGHLRLVARRRLGVS